MPGAPKPIRSTAIVESDSGGHRLGYVRLLADAARERGWQVTIVLPEGVMASAEFDLHLRGCTNGLSLTTDMPAVSPQGLASLAARLNVDQIIVPDGDRLAVELALHPWTVETELVVLVMREPELEQSDSTRAAMRNHTKRVALRVAEHRNHRGAARIVRLGLPTDPPSRHRAPDPVWFDASDKEIATLRASWGLDDGTFWFALVGAIDGRKNAPLLLRSFLVDPIPGAGMLIAGQQLPGGELDPAMVRQVKAAGIPLRVIDRPLTNWEYSAAVASADCVVMPYSTSNPPSTLGKALRAGTRVVLAGTPVFGGYLTRVGATGYSCALNSDEINVSMRAAMELGAPEGRTDLGTSGFVSAMLDGGE